MVGFVFNKAFGLSTLRLSGQEPPCPVSASSALRVSSWTPSAAGPCSLQPVSQAGSRLACTCCSCWGSVLLKNRRAGTCMHEQPLLQALPPQKSAEGRGAGIILGWSRLLPCDSTIQNAAAEGCHGSSNRGEQRPSVLFRKLVVRLT